MLARRAAEDAPSLGRSPKALRADAWSILFEFAHVLCGESGKGAMHDRLARAWKLDARGAHLIRRALVLMADHELNPSTFAVRIAAVDATAVVQEMQSLQNTMPLATLGVGRAMVGALLMASQLKDGQEVGLLFKGNGPLGNVYAEASFEGQVRGYCPKPAYQAPDANGAGPL